MKFNAFFLLCFLLSSSLWAQNNRPECGAPDPEKAAASNPETAKQIAAFEASVQQYIAENEASLAAGKTDEALKTKFVIPVVIHVIWGGNKQQVGSDSISLEQIESNFEALFNDFRMKKGTPGYSHNGIDYQVEFSLATKDPDGNPSTGVTYHYNPTASDWDRNFEGDYKSQITWPKTKYFNIWLVNTIDKSTSGNGMILGYAQFPNFGSASTDGVVIRTDCWGTIGTVRTTNNMGRVATHEIGHWLGLLHTFQGSCGGSNCQNSGDNVCDTPPTKQDNYGMGYDRQNTCTNEAQDGPDNPRNYMDYLNDAGKNYFSTGQRTRSWAVLNNATYPQRNSLWKDSNLQATGTGPYKRPKAGFTVSQKSTCVGNPIRFQEFSMGLPNVYKWEFEGGNPSTSTEEAPVVVYANADTYDVKLIVTNASGLSDTLVLNNYITITDGVKSLPLNEDFNATTFPPASWSLYNEDDYKIPGGNNNPLDVNWRRFPAAKSAIIRLGTYSDYDQVDGLITPSLDFSKAGEKFGALVYDISYVPLTYSESSLHPTALNYTDTLRIKVSLNCGDSWTEVYKKGGAELSITGGFTNEVVNLPDTSAWRTDSVSLDDFVGESNVRVMFETTNGFGNNLLIDNVKITYDSVKKVTLPEGVSQLMAAGSFKIAPNPHQGLTNLHFSLTETANVVVRVLDVQGREVYSRPAQTLTTGEQTVELNLANRAAGVYSVHVIANGKLYARKMIQY